MASVVMHTLRSLATPYVVRKAAGFIGEGQDTTARALDTAMPALVNGLGAAVRDPQVLKALHALAIAPANDGAMLNNVGAAFSPQQAYSPMTTLGTSMLETVFGKDIRLVEQAVAERAGIRPVSAQKLLSSVAPLVLAALGQHLRGLPGTGPAALAGLLGEQLSATPPEPVAAAVPVIPAVPVAAATTNGPAAAISEIATAHVHTPPSTPAPPFAVGGRAGRVRLADRIKLIVLADPPPRPVLEPVVPAAPAAPVLRPQPVGETRAAAAAAPRIVVHDAAVSAGKTPPVPIEPRGTLWPLLVGGLGGLILILGAPFFMSWLARTDIDGAILRGRPGEQEIRSDVPRSAPRSYETPRTMAPRLELDVPETSMERRFIRYIEDTRPLSNVDWFELDRITFHTGSHTLTPSSAEQIRNVAEILKAYPTVRLRIGGYTDNVGDPAKNLDLSTARANTVLKALTDQGIASSRLSAEGYGEQHPIADNATAEGRARNRRIAFRVLQR